VILTTYASNVQITIILSSEPEAKKRPSSLDQRTHNTAPNHTHSMISYDPEYPKNKPLPSCKASVQSKASSGSDPRCSLNIGAVFQIFTLVSSSSL
jgi:hypothetical protein